VASKPRAETADFLDSFHGAHIVGRWLLVGAESIVGLLLFATEQLSREAVFALALLFLYNAASLVVIHRIAVHRLPVLLVLALDLLFVWVVGRYTGGPDSPFLGQCYLIIFAGALFYGIKGGVAVSVSAVLLVLALAEGRADALAHLARDTVPYFLVAGGFTGYLVREWKIAFRLYQESRVRERERALETEADHREIALARTIQAAAIPQTPPRIEGLEIAVRCEFARTVGGDFLLFLSDGSTEPTKHVFVIGDASGKGVPAALVATSIAHLLPWLRPLEDPAAALQTLNRDLFERLPREAFVTLTLVELDVREGRIRLWPAGHPPAILCRAGQSRVEHSSTYNRPVGMFAEWEPSVEEWPLQAADTLLLYSDGLIEARNETGEQFGVERCERAFDEVAGRSAEEIVETLGAAVHAWGHPTDDLTLLVVRRVDA
jgi:serine phosphatase RsbU (regulator of sigma subunit)